MAKAKAGGAMKFWFTGGGELAEPQLATEVGSLNAFSAAQLNGFVDTVIAFLLNPAVRGLAPVPCLPVCTPRGRASSPRPCAPSAASRPGGDAQPVCDGARREPTCTEGAGQVLQRRVLQRQGGCAIRVLLRLTRLRRRVLVNRTCAGGFWCSSRAR